MKKVPNAKVIEAFEIVELLSDGKSDEEIAKHFGCHPTVVRSFRKNILSVKPIIKAPIVKARKTEARNSPPTKDYLSFQSDKSLEGGSRRLLIRQLETGQHALDKPRFIAVVKELGLAHRLPEGFRHDRA